MQCRIPVLIWILIILCMTFENGLADEAYYNKSYALVVGISKYASIRWKNLPYARSDAKNVAEALKQQGFEVLSLFDRDATRHAILARLEKNITPRLQPDDRVLFYFSGHGYTKQNGDNLETYLIPYDKEIIEMKASQIYISMSDLERQSKLMSIAKHQFFIIDAPITAIDQSKGDGIMLTNPDYVSMVTQKKARQLLVAGNNKKIPVSSDASIHNVLSKLFVQGLDEGRADINGDGIITCLEICSYIMPRATNVGQKPDYATFSEHEMGEFVFSSPESVRKKIAEEDNELDIEDLTVDKKPPPIVDIQEGRLYIKTIPEDSRIRVLNIVPPYRYGMMLSPGNYKIEVSKPGYQTKIQWITIANQDRIHETIELKSTRPYSQFFINPDPPDARIRIMNIVPPYSHGMALQAGRYLIQIDKPGYKSYKQWVTISKGKDCIISPVLKLKTSHKKLQKIEVQAKKKTDEIKELPLKPEKIQSSQTPVKIESKKEKPVIKKTKPIESKKEKPVIKKTKPIESKKEKPVIKKAKSKEKIDLETKTQPKQLTRQKEQPKPQPKQTEPKPETQKVIKQTTPKKEKVVPKEFKTDTHHQHITDGNQWQEKTTGMIFVHVKGGCYEMGCGEWTGQCDPDELPVHQVCVKDFWMGQYEVTQNEWKIIMGNNPSMSAYGSHYPVEKVSWDDVQTYIKKLEKKSKHRFRLPTEAEWEYACRSGGKPQKYSGKGLDINHLGWFNENSVYITHGVGIKSANMIDLFDMSGNVSEWCLDAYQSDAYKKHRKNNPQVKHGKVKVVRGGDWSDQYTHLRCSDRRGYASDLKSKDLGFRLIRLGK